LTGKPNLAELRFSVEVVLGVTHTVIVRGEQSDGDVYTVDVSLFQTVVGRGGKYECNEFNRN
jgi:hypothetical protein